MMVANWRKWADKVVSSAPSFALQAAAWRQCAYELEKFIEWKRAGDADTTRKEYKHFAHCNGDRTVPAGEPGHSCCCFSAGAAAAGSRTFAEGIEAAAKIVDAGLVKWRAKEPVTFQGIAKEIRALAQEKWAAPHLGSLEDADHTRCDASNCGCHVAPDKSGEK